MIHYEEIEPYLIDFLQGEVAEEVEYRIRAYLQQNPDFQQELDELEETLEFSHHAPLVQPSPALKMNFYAMLNEQKALQATARPSLRERIKHFLQTQFYWQSLSVAVFALLITMIGYWGIAAFQKRFKNTEVALQNLEFEKEKASKTPAYIDIQMPKRKEAITRTAQENATQGQEKAALPEIHATTTTPKAQEEQHKNIPEAEISKIIHKDSYSFVNKDMNGIVQVNNPRGNINLKGYAGNDVKIETIPIQSYVGSIDNNHITIDGLPNAPQIDMQVLLPQNRQIQLTINAKQNIAFDLSGIQLTSNSSLTSIEGNVIVQVPETTSLEINVLAQEIENDFVTESPFYNSNSALPASTNQDVKTTESTTNYKREADMEAVKARGKNTGDPPPASRKEKKSVAKKAEKESVSRAKDADKGELNNPAIKSLKIPLRNSNKNLQINSLQGTTKIKKIK